MAIKLSKVELRVLRVLSEYPPKTGENYHFDTKSRLFPILMKKSQTSNGSELQILIDNLVRYGFLDWKLISGISVVVPDSDGHNKLEYCPQTSDLKFLITRPGMEYLNVDTHKWHDIFVRILWIAAAALIGAIIGAFIDFLFNLAYLSLAGGAVGAVGSQLIRG